MKSFEQGIKRSLKEFIFEKCILTPASLEDAEKSNLFLRSGGTDWRKTSQRLRRSTTIAGYAAHRFNLHSS